jgi:hypothetical protein
MGMEQGGYTTDSGGGDQGSYDYGGGGDFNLSMGAGGDTFAVDYASMYSPTDTGAGFDEYSFLGFDFAPPGTVSPGGDAIAWGGGAAPIDFAPYEQQWGLEPPRIEPIPDSMVGGGDLFGAYLDYYLEMGFDQLTAMELAAQDAAALSFRETTSEVGYADYQQSWPIEPPKYLELPDGPFYPLPYVPYEQSWPLEPPTPEPLPTPPPLPGPCPGGTYHPMENPYICVPFPPAQQQAPKPPQQQPKSSAQQAPRPPQQPAQAPCPVLTHWRNPRTGKCEPKPKCPAPSVFDAQVGACVLPNRQTVPPEPGPDAGDDGSNNNWWLLLLAAGAIAFATQGGGESEYTPRRRSRR